MTSRSLGHRAPLLWLALPLISGLAAGKTFEIGATGWPLAGATVLATAAILGGRRAPGRWALALISALFLAGTASYALQRARIPTWDVLPSREVRITLRVDRVFAQGDSRKATGLATVIRTDGHLPELTGQRIYFSLQLRSGMVAPVRSAIVSTIGILATLPHHPPADTFDGYLAAAGMNFKLTRGRILAEEKAPRAYYRFCAGTAARFKDILGRGIAKKRPALAGLLRAMMLGETHELSDEQHTLFMQSGTMHLFAISGLNITVIAVAIDFLLRLVRLPAAGRFIAGAILLWLFVDITGGSSSAVRAFVMTVFLHASRVFRRPGNPFAALVASAVAVLLVAPLQIFSASFLMSYGIVTALLLLGLPMAEAWQTRWSPWRDLPPPTWLRWQRWIAAAWRKIATTLAFGVATTLVSLITGVQFFRLLTPGALLSNLALIPAAVVVTVGGFAAILCGLIGFDAGAVLCNHAAAVMLLAIEALVRLSVDLPGAFVPAQFVAPWIGPVAFSLLMAALLAGYATNWERLGGCWPPFAVATLTLVFGVRYG